MGCSQRFVRACGRIDRGSDAGRSIPSGIAASPRQGSPSGPSRVASLGGDGVQSLRGGAGVSDGTGCAGADAACGGGGGRPKSGAGPRGDSIVAGLGSLLGAGCGRGEIDRHRHRHARRCRLSLYRGCR